jgi:hypothetical protein
VLRFLKGIIPVLTTQVLQKQKQAGYIFERNPSYPFPVHILGCIVENGYDPGQDKTPVPKIC